MHARLSVWRVLIRWSPTTRDDNQRVAKKKICSGLTTAAGETSAGRVDGLTLADRIAYGRLSLDEALSIGRQIAQALEAAHEQGVIHRDLTPSNIKITAVTATLDAILAGAPQEQLTFEVCVPVEAVFVEAE